MTVLVEAWRFGRASAPLFEDSRRWFSCGVRELEVTGVKRKLGGAGECEIALLAMGVVSRSGVLGNW